MSKDQRTLRVILLEDSPPDAELARAAIDEAGLVAEVRVVDTRHDFERLLAEWPCDLVLSDYSMPSFDGATALALARAHRPEVPFIFVSGSIGEERAVDALRRGATDYVLKDRLSKLPMVIRRALDEAREKREHAEAQATLARRERDYRALVEEIPAIFYMARPDEHGSTSFVSPQVEAMLGYTQAAWIADPALWSRLIHPDDRDRVFEAWNRFCQDRSKFDIEYRLRAKDGRIVWAQDFGRFFGDPPMVRGFLVDITERKNLEQQFQHAQKLEALGRLAGGVAHDFNNLLTVINGYSDLVAADLADDCPAREDLALIREAGQRAQTLTRQLLAFSRRQVIRPVPLHLGELLTSMSKMLPRLVGEDVTLTTTVAQDIGFVKADPGQIEQVVMNLVVNARDAMPQGGRIDISVDSIELPRTSAEDTPGAHTSPCIRLSVSDTGEGIPPAVRDRIFEPFFTTKAVGHGTGLGLSTVHGIVTQAGGMISVDSTVGRGTTFRILFPQCAESPEAPRVSTKPDVRPGEGCGTVLLVEDSEGVRRLATAILARFGYGVIPVADPADALRFCQEHGSGIQVLLTDVVMKTMTGPELVQLVRRLHPSVRVVYMSGYLNREMDPLELLKDGARFVAKPFTAAELVDRVREALAESESDAG